MEESLGIILRISVIYIYALIVLRLAGKRSIGDMTLIDFVVANMLGDLLEEMIWANVPLSEGLAAITTIILLHVLVSFFEHRSDRIHFLVTADKTLVVKNGSFVEQGLRRERTARAEVASALRMNGEERLDAVHEAYWEPDGHLSVIKKQLYQEAQKKDLPALEKLFK